MQQTARMSCYSLGAVVRAALGCAFLMRGTVVVTVALIGIPLLLLSGTASAATVTFNYDISFGSVTPDGPAPYVTSIFDDGGSAGTVVLTMMVAATVNDADVTDMYFNLDPSLDPTLLTFSRVSGTGPIDADVTPLTGVDAFTADGDGMFDILFELPPPPGGQSVRFNAGEDLVYQISGIPTLTASSFNIFSDPAGSFGPFLSAAMFVDTGPGGLNSDFVGAIPEPSTLTLLSLGILLIAGAAWRRRLRRS